MIQHENSTPETTPSNNTSETPAKIKAVFFDIDGTLIGFKTRIMPDSTITAIKRLREKGIKVIVATGRSFQATRHIHHLEFDGFVTFNGSFCVDKEGNTLSRRTIDPENIIGLLEYTEKNPLNFVLMYENEVAVNQITPEISSMHFKLDLPLPPLVDRNNTDVSNVLQANVFLAPELEAEFMESIMPGCTATRWTPLFADINPFEISKKVGVDIFCTHFGIDVRETMSFGDGGNDITMLQHTGIGVAMGNAGDNVKIAADYITDDSENDGILRALLHFGILSD